MKTKERVKQEKGEISEQRNSFLSKLFAIAGEQDDFLKKVSRVDYEKLRKTEHTV